MIKLIDGKGQLGDELSKLTKEKSGNFIIYHTWNVSDKSENAQKECYLKFKEFVDKNKEGKIVFVSTYSQTENSYNYYKQLAEAYLLSNNGLGYVIRLPTLIGKGICAKFRSNEMEAFGEMELMSIEDAAKEVLKVAESNTLVRSFRIKGVLAPASFVKRLIEFGRDGK